MVLWALVLAVVAAGNGAHAVAAPRLATDSERATAGFFRLSWEADATDVRLERAPTAEFAAPERIYEGPDRARVLSGQPNGTWHFRVAAVGDGRPMAWSAPVTVTVEHHPLTRALLFFGLGGVVFLSTLAVIVHGSRREAE